MRTCQECGADISHRNKIAVSCSVRCGDRIAHRKAYKKNPDKYRARVNAYYHANKDAIAKKYDENRAEINARKRAEYAANPKKKSDYYRANRGKIDERRDSYYVKNKEKLAAINRIYREENKAKLKALRDENRARTAAYAVERRIKDPQFAISSRLRARIRSALGNKKKKLHTVDLLGCNVSEFMLHIQKQFKPGMNWNNRSLWHIDHILPCSSFDMTNETHVRQCFHFTNMQPLWASENMAKGSKLPAQHQPSLPI